MMLSTTEKSDWYYFHSNSHRMVDFRKGGGHNIQDVKIDTAQIQPADRTLLAATFAEAALRFYQVAEHQEQYQQWSQQQGGEQHDQKRA